MAASTFWYEEPSENTLKMAESALDGSVLNFGPNGEDAGLGSDFVAAVTEDQKNQIRSPRWNDGSTVHAVDGQLLAESAGCRYYRYACILWNRGDHNDRCKFGRRERRYPILKRRLQWNRIFSLSIRRMKLLSRMYAKKRWTLESKSYSWIKR